MGARIVVDGDIFAPADHLVVGHGVNTEGVMGAGFAALVADRLPEAVPSTRKPADTPTPGGAWLPGAQLIAVRGFGGVANVAGQDLPGPRDQWPDELCALLDGGATPFQARFP